VLEERCWARGNQSLEDVEQEKRKGIRERNNKESRRDERVGVQIRKKKSARGSPHPGSFAMRCPSIVEIRTEALAPVVWTRVTDGFLGGRNSGLSPPH
jgi:hypothetical protein